VKVDEFDFELPERLIAQAPAERRDASRLLTLDRTTGVVTHGRFTDLPDHLRDGDLLVLNDTKVLPARLHGTKPTGGRVEMLVVERVEDPGRGAASWRAMIDGSRSLRPGAVLTFPGGLTASILEREGDLWRVQLLHDRGDPAEALEAVGEIPLPPYIRRGPGDSRSAADRERYQTVYAAVPGAVAAPTAGLHFTAALLESLRARGIATTELTLHVGPGTFLPLRVDDVERHRMHEESYVLPAFAADAIASARSRGGRVVAVGTTVARTLESCADGRGGVVAGRGRSALFIYPGFRFQVVDALVTNFHLPRSTLLMLVCALAGTPSVLAAYGEAIREGYRFYSYGDAMLVRSA
jgi:S-adenosylmethionine:tRNA ribosyltransferase-isomerase